MSVSVPNFEQEDQQVIDMVNANSSPEAAANAEDIVKGPAGWEDPEQMIAHEIAKIGAERATKKRKKQERLSVIGIVLCVIVAAALLVVLANPQWLVWLVNIGVAACCTIAGIILDRRFRGGKYAV